MTSKGWHRNLVMNPLAAPAIAWSEFGSAVFCVEKPIVTLIHKRLFIYASIAWKTRPHNTYWRFYFDWTFTVEQIKEASVRNMHSQVTFKSSFWNDCTKLKTEATWTRINCLAEQLISTYLNVTYFHLLFEKKPRKWIAKTSFCKNFQLSRYKYWEEIIHVKMKSFECTYYLFCMAIISFAVALPINKTFVNAIHPIVPDIGKRIRNW